MKSMFLWLALLLSVIMVQGQEKKRLTHDDYAIWNNLGNAEIAPNGQFSLYLVNPQQGDGHLHVYNHQSRETMQIPRGARAAFSPGSGFAVFHISPQRTVVRQARVDKKKREEMPVDSLGILVLSKGEVMKFEGIKNYRLPKENSNWLAFVLDHSGSLPFQMNTGESMDTLETEEKKPARAAKPTKIKQLIVMNPIAGQQHVFDHVEHFDFAENGSSILFLQDTKDSLKTKKLMVFNTLTETTQELDQTQGEFKSLVVSKTGDLFASLHTSDTTKVKTYTLKVYQSGRRPRTYTIDGTLAGMPQGYSVSEFRRPSFSDDNQRVFLGIAPNPEPEKEDTLLADEKYNLDIWHWQDPILQSQQRVSHNQLRQQNFQAVFHLRNQKLVPLGDENIPRVVTDREGIANVFLGYGSTPYLLESTWAGFSLNDLYLIDAQTGSRRMIEQRAESQVQLSPGGNYVLYYDVNQRQWMCYSVRRNTRVSLTAQLPVAFYNEDHDMPSNAGPYGVAGWAEKDGAVYIYDQFDIWKFSPEGLTAPVNITAGYGRKNDTRLRYENLDPDDPFFPESSFVVNAFHIYNKQSGYMQVNGRTQSLEKLVMDDVRYSELKKARDAEQYLWRKSTFTEYPDLWTSTLRFDDARKISDANPQQIDYLWGSVKLVEWQDFNNKTLQGLLYLPENFDPNRKYPMLVYFYEISSHGLHQHFVPSPSRSTINRSYCTSNDYIVFVPDITYRDGYPGQSGYNAIVSGTKAMTERYSFIDRANMGLQGQSWGGYQIAYLVTQTDMFKAAMAGAPVSNMISAYGGIRWESGRSRQFQYENTQSRIGGTLWEKPLQYMENSPIFYIEKINTPLLIMHNDEDGAVPWYQGIEMFVAMRRLAKPAWMLVYNREAHNLMHWPNRMDLSIRMYQFFDHYLKGEPAPRWMVEGRPFIDRTRTDAYDLMD